MNSLELTLSWLELSKYLETFQQAGFDSWGILMEITEEDLDVLGVELGHRRKLQREIANTRAQAERSVPRSHSNQDKPRGVLDRRSSVTRVDIPKQDSQPSALGKRGYRHHPKPDEDAPQRPYSAYVLFSNWLREEKKDEAIPFAEMSKRVGERWQALLPEEKESWKQKAAIPWEKYKQHLADYQETEKCRKYTQYVTDFNAAQASKRNMAKGEGKREYSPTLLHTTKFGQPHFLDGLETAVPQRARGHASSPPNAVFPNVPNSRGGSGIEPNDLRRQETGVPIPRINWTSTNGSAAEESAGTRVSRVNHACEPCRQKKSKCDGERPTCKHCQALSIACVYQDGKKDRGNRTTEELWKKVSAYEDLILQIAPELNDDQRSAAQRALRLPPQRRNGEDVTSRIPKTLHSHGSDSGGESITSGVGSMGSTDHVNENNFNAPAPEAEHGSFAGQASDTTWMQKLTSELTKSRDQSTQSAVSNTLATPSSNSRQTASLSKTRAPILEDMDPWAIDDQIDPYEMPVRLTADFLVKTYFTTVHLSYPIIDEHAFLNDFAQFYATSDPGVLKNQKFMPMLQIVFAIAAIHAHMTEAHWVGDDRDHLLYFARARIFSNGSGVLDESVHLGQVQILGLASMYLLATCQVNRAWNILGLAIRSAQGLGMHLENVTPDMPESDKLHRQRIWFSIVSQERILSTVVGRPCMVKEQDCSIPMLLPPSRAGDGHSREASVSSQAYSSMEPRRFPGSSKSSGPSLRSTESGVKASSLSIAATYFFHYVELHALSQRILQSLYAPEVRQLKWAEIQRIIIKFDRQLSQWIATLPPALNPDTPSPDPHSERFRESLAILSHSLRAIINRPCLCKISLRITHQSSDSIRDNRESANKCVTSAQTMLMQLPTKPDPRLLHQSPIWWMILHHIKRAATVLLLELSFRAEHMPSEAEEILADAKKAINWIRSLARSSVAAYRSWKMLNTLLRLAAERIGGPTEDIINVPPEETPIQRMPDSNAQQASANLRPSHVRGFDPTGWEPMDFHQFGGFTTAGDVRMSGPGDFGFDPQAGSNSLFPTPSEMGQMAVEQNQPEDYQNLYQPAETDTWYGFNPGM